MATKSKPRPRNPIVNLNDDQKHKLERAITRAVNGPFSVEFSEIGEMQFGLFDDCTSAVGHVWYINIEPIENEGDLHGWSLDDRDGDIRKLIADSLRQRAKLLMRWADKVEAVELSAEGGAE